MKKDQERVAGPPAADRRNFLKLAGLGTVGTVAAAASSVTAIAGETASDNTDGYRETEHVRRVYELSRF